LRRCLIAKILRRSAYRRGGVLSPQERLNVKPIATEEVETEVLTQAAPIMPRPKQARMPSEFMRFVIAGAIATAFDFAVLVMLTRVAEWNYLAANACSFMAGNVVSYLICTQWVFNERALRSRAAEFAIFAVVGIGALGISQLCMWMMVGVFAFHYLIAKTASVGCTVFFNFFIKRFLLFQQKRTARAHAQMPV
jgi:putative flippase GtrA